MGAGMVEVQNFHIQVLGREELPVGQPPISDRYMGHIRAFFQNRLPLINQPSLQCQLVLRRPRARTDGPELLAVPTGCSSPRRVTITPSIETETLVASSGLVSLERASERPSFSISLYVSSSDSANRGRVRTEGACHQCMGAIWAAGRVGVPGIKPRLSSTGPTERSPRRRSSQR